ncbi:MAG TPA: M48 family metallopeptidase [Candidatus Binatia bacterium]
MHPKAVVSLALLFLFAFAPEVSAIRKGRAGRYDDPTRSEQQIARLRDLMLPLLRVTNHRISLDDVRVSIVDDPAVNAASAGDGRYYVTTGLLNQATDDQLRGVLAHEIAHEDLGHPARAQVVGAGVDIGVALLEQLFPGSSAVTPMAGTLITNSYTRPLEIEADRHAVTLLRRAGYPKETMLDTLVWLARRNGDTGGGLLSTHPATSERIQALRSMR